MWITLFSLLLVSAACAMESPKTVAWTSDLDSAVAQILPDFSQSDKEQRMLMAYRLVHVHKVRSASTLGRGIKKQYLYESAWVILRELYRSQLVDRDQSSISAWLKEKDDAMLSNLGETIAQTIIHYSSKK